MNTQPEALRLADWLENEPGYDWNRNYCLAVAELRRLHEENEALRQALAQPKQKYDYRVKYDRPCYKCRSNFCPGNCKEPKYLTQPEQEPVAIVNEGMGGIEWLSKPLPDDTPLYTAPAKQPEREPVAWTVFDRRRGKHWYTNESKYTAQYYANLYSHRESDGNPSMVVMPLYTAPPKREWVGLTDEQRAVLNFMLGADELDGVWFGDRHPKEKDSFWWRNRLRNAFQDADIEAKLKEKNT